MHKAKETLLIFFEAVAIGGALLLVPCVLADLAFGCQLTEPLAQVVLAAAVSTALLTAVALNEGWYADHLTRMTGAGEDPPDPQGRNPPRDERWGHCRQPCKRLGAACQLQPLFHSRCNTIAWLSANAYVQAFWDFVLTGFGAGFVLITLAVVIGAGVLAWWSRKID